MRTFVGKYMKNKGYIFDYGGTLDTCGCHWGKVLWHAYEYVGVPVSEEQFREAYVYAERYLGTHPVVKPTFTFRQTLETKLELELAHLSTLSGKELGTCKSALLEKLYADVTATTAHSREVLRALKENCPMVLVSNFYGNIAVVLREFGLDTLFDRVIESAVVGIRKPDPQIFALGVEALGMEPSDVAVVGDSFSKDILPARQIGCQTIWFKGEGWTDESEDETIPDKIITDLSDLIEYTINTNKKR